MNSQQKFTAIGAVITACLFSSLMGAAFFQAHVEDPHFSSLSGSFIRVIANFILVMILTFSYRHRPQLLFSPRKHKSLWTWGLFGALTVTTYFAAIHLIGSGMTAFLGASSGIFIAGLSAPLARQHTPPIMWLAILGSIGGMFLLCSSVSLNESWLGVSLALSSGLFAAIAYLMVARNRSTYSVNAVMVTWCIAALIAHAVIFCLAPFSFPANLTAWMYIIFAAIAASLAQQFTTYAFQRTSPSAVASLSYLTPVLSLILDMLAFGFMPTLQAGVGAALIVSFGAFLPVLHRG